MLHYGQLKGRWVEVEHTGAMQVQDNLVRTCCQQVTPYDQEATIARCWQSWYSSLNAPTCCSVAPQTCLLAGGGRGLAWHVPRPWTWWKAIGFSIETWHLWKRNL